MAGGRPTVYGEDIVANSLAYIQDCEDELTAVVTMQGDGYTKYEQKLKVKIPTIEGLARYLKIHRTTLYEWQKEHIEFSYIIEELQQKQIERLLANGLSGDYNSTIAKVLLARHGYTDKTEIDQKTEHSGSVAITWEEPPIRNTGNQSSTGELPGLQIGLPNNS